MSVDTEEVVIRANDGTYFVILEARKPDETSYATAESFPSMKQLVMWVIDEIDYYLSNATVKEAEEIVRTGGVAVIDLPVGTSLTIHRSDNRGAKLDLPLKKED